MCNGEGKEKKRKQNTVETTKTYLANTATEKATITNFIFKSKENFDVEIIDLKFQDKVITGIVVVFLDCKDK